MGRFTSIDPVVIDTNRKEFQIAMARPQMMNGYSYAGNNPVKYTDENGEFIPFLAAYAVVTANIWVPSLIAGVGLVGGSIASWHLGEGLGYYAGKDYAKGDSAVNTSIFTSVLTGEAVTGVLAIGEMIGAGTVIVQNNQRANSNQSVINNKAETSLPDSALVVRGGAHTAPETFEIDVHPSGVKGFSVESKAGADLCKLCTNLPNNQVRTTTVKDVRAAGGNVVPTTGRSPNHATVTNLNPQTANKVFSQPIKNPVPKALRKK